MNNRGAFHPTNVTRATVARGPARPRRAPPEAREVAPRGRKAGVGLFILATLWFFILFEPQWLLAARGTTAALKAPVVLFLLVGATLAVGVPMVKAWRDRWTWYAPYLAYVLVCIAAVPFAPNTLLAREETQAYFLWWVLIVATVALVDTARRAERLVLLYGLQFVIWGALGAASGFVAWHTSLSNYDGYGAFMVIGGGLCAFLYLAADNKWLKRAMLLAVALAAIGVVASFARGAALAAALVAGVVWLRSPRKGMALLGGLGCLVLVMAASFILYPGEYWAEIATIAQGTEEATGEDRWEMWKAGWQVFLQHPILGTGAKNWGVFASTYFRPGDLGGDFAMNPGMLYNRSLHSSYVQVLAEHGILGAFTFGWIIWDFWRRNIELKTRAAAERWRAMGGKLKLRHVALATEAAFIGWLGSAAVYSQSGTHWFATILALNLLIHTLVTDPRAMATGGPAGNRQLRGRGRPGRTARRG